MTPSHLPLLWFEADDSTCAAAALLPPPPAAKGTVPITSPGPDGVEDEELHIFEDEYVEEGKFSAAAVRKRILQDQLTRKDGTRSK